MNNSSEFKENSQAVQAHLEITQSVIQRMANNSASCKAWCITLVSAILVIVADKSNPKFTLIAILPNFLFLILVEHLTNPFHFLTHHTPHYKHKHQFVAN